MSKLNHDHQFEYDTNNPSFRALHNIAVIASAATFDRKVENVEIDKIPKSMSKT